MRPEPRVRGIRRYFALPRSLHSIDREVDDEIQFHLETRVAALVGRGIAPEEARALALREYGDVAASRRELKRLEHRRLTRERWSTRWESVRQDLTYALRGLGRQPGFSASVIAVLALGIGANATMFGIVDRLLLRPPAHVADPARVVTTDFVRSFNRSPIHQDYLSYPQYLDLAGTPGVFDGVAAYTLTDLAVGRGAEARAARGMRVSASYFTMLGVRAERGRFLLPGDDGAPVAPNVAVISHGFWQRQYAGGEAIGRVMRLGDLAYTIVGVAPRGFQGLSSSGVDVWIPITSGQTPREIAGWTASRDGYWLQVAARLRKGVTRERAASVASRVLVGNMRRDGTSATRIAENQPRFEFTSVLPREARAHDANAKVALLLGAVSLLVLVIACANVSNLQLARGLRRRREMAVRTALGAGVARLMQQLAIEGGVLAALGGAAALGVAWSGGMVMRRAVFSMVDWEDLSAVDLHVLAYAAAAALVVGLLAGLVPASQARRAHLAAALKEGAREGRVHQSVARMALLIVQAALSIVMLVGTGLFVRSLRQVESLPMGMEPDRVLVAELNLNGATYTPPEIDALYRRLEGALASDRAVESAAISTSLPFWTSWGTSVRVPGRDSLPRVRDGGPYFSGVTPGYLRTMGMRLLRGRDFTLADGNHSGRVMIVNDAFARLAWPNEEAIGRCVKLGGDTMPCAEVVGVVANARRQEIIEDVSLQLFVPIEQAPAWVQSRTLVIRPRGADAPREMESVRRYMQTAIPDLPFINVRWMQDLVSPQTRSWRMGASVFCVFGMLALLLAMVGLYSMLSYDVAQRTHELGVRVALGARRGDVARLIAGAGARVIAIGTTIGLGITVLAGRFVAPLLFNTSPYEPEILLAAVGVMVLVTVAATIVPTSRALAVDPIIALKTD